MQGLFAFENRLAWPGSEAPEAHWEAINTFLDRNVEAEPGPSQDVALAMDSFAQAAMEAKLELDTRADR